MNRSDSPETNAPSFAEREVARLQVLHQLNLLDTPVEESFDRLTALAARIFQVPVALITLIDAERQWFKSCYGAEYLGVRETARDIAFCSHVVEQEAPLVIHDATLDTLFSQHPFVIQAPDVRFYAGVPLRVQGGAVLGTLALVDFKAREFTAADTKTLADLAELVSYEIAQRQSTVEANRAERRLRTLIDGTSDIITILDAEGIIRYESGAIEPILGYKPDELLGTPALEWIHPDDRNSVGQALGDIAALGEAAKAATFRFRHRNGTWRVLEAVGRGRLDDPNIAGIVVSSRDVTERQQTEEHLRLSEEQLRLALDAGQMGVWKADSIANTLWWSPRMEQAHGLEVGSFDGRAETFLACVHPDDHEIVSRIAHQTDEGREFIAEYRVLLPDGTTRWLEARGVPVFEENRIAHVTGIVADISERKASETLLRQEAAQLEKLTLAQNAIAVAGFDLRNVMQEILKRSLTLAGADSAAILTVNGDSLVLSASTEEYDNAQLSRLIPWGNGSTVENAVLRCNDAQTDARVDSAECRRAQIGSLLAAPLQRGDETAWVLLATATRPDAFSERDEKTFELLRGLCAAVISRALEFGEKQSALLALARSEGRKSAILETALDCIITIDSEGNVIEWNPAAAKTFGYSREETLGQALAEMIVPPELRQAHSHGVHRFVTTGVGPILGQRLELPAVRKDGTRIDVELAVVAIPETEPPLFTGHLRDITARKEGEAALEAARVEAEEQREIAERANLAKSEFLSRMSHELRTPLNAILGFGQLLEMSPLSEDDRESAEQIAKAGRHLLGLINEVLDIARIESGQLSLSVEPVEVGELCHETLAFVRHSATQRGIVIDNQTPDKEHFVLADRQRLRQILLNLLSNAVKYNKEDGEIRLFCVETDERLRICVCDSGIGVPPEKIDRLFTPFDRLDAERTGIEGSGIGLALSRRLAESMNGTVEIDRTSTDGTVFWVELPLVAGVTPEDETAAERPATSDNTANGHTVLYIEDNASNLQLVERLLTLRPGMKLLTAGHGAQGIELAQTQMPSLVLLDVHLPEISGEEVLRLLKADTRTLDIPVVILSADATPRQIERLLKAGAHAYLTKPFDIQMFLRAFDEALGMRASKAETSENEATFAV
ncbi:MAG TPA: PAS domain S-box protein [Abditibacteriaceae bacterium]